MRLTRIPVGAPGLEEAPGGDRWCACWPIVDQTLPIKALMEEARALLTDQLTHNRLRPTGAPSWWLCEHSNGDLELYATVPVIRRTSVSTAA